MQAEELLQQGDVEEALQALQESVRNEPSNPSLRVFLFQLLCIRGEWERALTQLKLSGELDPINLAMVQTYREAVRCELFRQKVFSGEKSPLIFGNPPQWAAYLIEALRLLGAGEHSKSSELRNQAFELAPATGGEIDGQPFQWIADADPRIGPVLEAVVNGRYYWIPMQRLAKVDIEAPADLRDMVWTPAHLTFANEGVAVALIPARYPGSENSSDSAIQLARRTDWEQPVEDFYLGKGQRMFATDSDDYSLLSTRQIVLRPDDTEAAG